MSYSDIKPEYYRMFQPDSPWHAGSDGWKDAPWPGWGRNPNLVGPPRLAVNGMGAYYAPEYETPISGLGAYYAPEYETPISGLGGCGCGAKSVGANDPSAPALATATLGWLLVGGIAGAALWVTGMEIGLIRKGKH